MRRRNEVLVKADIVEYMHGGHVFRVMIQRREIGLKLEGELSLEEDWDGHNEGCFPFFGDTTARKGQVKDVC